MMPTSVASVADPNEFVGKRVLVTGGTQGMGEAIVRRLQGGGAEVATAARSPLPSGQAPELFVQADVSTSEGVRSVVEAVQARFGGLDFLVNVVGGSSSPSGGFALLDDYQWERELAVNLFPSIRLDRAFVPGMIEQGKGVVIHVSSIQSRLPGAVSLQHPDHERVGLC